MKITYFNKKEGVAKLAPESLDDLYHISKIVELGDLASAMSSRKIKIGGEQSRQSATRRPCFIKIKVNKVELDYVSSVLRLSGEVVEAPEEVTKGSAHTLTIEINTKLVLHKNSWKRHHIVRLDKAKTKRASSAILVCSLDDDISAFASISDSGVRELGEIELSLASKRAKVSATEQYKNLVAALRNYYNQLNPSGVVIVSPGFWKDELFKVLKDKDSKLAKKVRIESVSAGGLSGVKELVKKGVNIKDSTIEEETKFVEELGRRISKNGKVAYSFVEVKKVISAVEKLAISEKFISKVRKTGNYSRLEKLIDSVEGSGGKVFVIDNKSDAGKILDGLGGIAALLRYRI